MTAFLLTALCLLPGAQAQDLPPPLPADSSTESAESTEAGETVEEGTTEGAVDPHDAGDPAHEEPEATDSAGDSGGEHAGTPEHAGDPEPHDAEPNAEHAPESSGHSEHEADAPPEPVGLQPAPAPQPTPGLGSGLFDFLGDGGADTPPEDRPDVVVVNQGNRPIAGPFDRILPSGPQPGLAHAWPLGFLAVLCVMLATLFRRSTRDLRSSGLIPQILLTAEVVFRLLAAAFGIAAIGALVPRALAPALPVVIVAAAIAAGWSARDVLQDLVAGIFLGVEGQLRAGHWVRGDRYSGTVEAMGLRVTWLRDVYGRRIVVPNRVLLAQPLVADDNPWPRIQFTVAMPSDASTRTIRAALEEAILVSPWVAPTPDVEVHPDGIEPGHWHIAVRLLDSQYADRFQGLLRERVEEILP